jgi:integrase
MERLGHADDEITRRVYLHVTKTMKKEASHKFSELMKSLYQYPKKGIIFLSFECEH